MTYRPWFDRAGTRPRIGVELEMNSQTTTGSRLSTRTLYDALRVAVPTPNRVRDTGGYGHSDGNTWDVKTDGSCGLEVATPAVWLDEEGDNAELKAGIEALAALRPQVDRRCGLHVWVEVRDFDWRDMRRLLALWARFEPYYFSLLPTSRYRNAHGGENQYCRPMRRAEWTGPISPTWNGYKQAIEAQSESAFRTAAQNVATKYQALNISTWWRTGRIEFRLHSGTVDYDKVKNWTKLLLALVGRVKAPNLPSTACTTTFPMDGTPTQPNDRTWVTEYVAKSLGLTPSRGNPDVPSTNAALVRWAEARRVRFTNPRARYS